MRHLPADTGRFRRSSTFLVDLARDPEQDPQSAREVLGSVETPLKRLR
jgi:hypothetical protein